MSDKRKAIIIGILFIGFIGIYQLRYSYFEKRYSIAKVIGFSTGYKQGTTVEYEFKYSGISYKNHDGREGYKPRKGEYYIVEIPKDGPDKSKILMYYPVPDSIGVQIPYMGWEEIPLMFQKYKTNKKWF